MIYIVDRDTDAAGRLSRRLSMASLPSRTYADTEAFLRQLEPERAGVILLGVHSLELSELSLVERAAALGATQPTVVIADQGNVALCRHAFKLGAAEFIERPIDENEIAAVLQQLFRTRQLQHSRRLCERRALERYARVSPREREVLAMIVAGMTNREIGRALNLSARTVEVHRARLIAKLEVDSLAQLVRQYGPLVDHGAA